MTLKQSFAFVMSDPVYSAMNEAVDSAMKSTVDFVFLGVTVIVAMTAVGHWPMRVATEATVGGALRYENS